MLRRVKALHLHLDPGITLISASCASPRQLIARALVGLLPGHQPYCLSVQSDIHCPLLQQKKHRWFADPLAALPRLFHFYPSAHLCCSVVTGLRQSWSRLDRGFCGTSAPLCRWQLFSSRVEGISQLVGIPVRPRPGAGKKFPQTDSANLYFCSCNSVIICMVTMLSFGGSARLDPVMCA